MLRSVRLNQARGKSGCTVAVGRNSDGPNAGIGTVLFLRTLKLNMSEVTMSERIVLRAVALLIVCIGNCVAMAEPPKPSTDVSKPRLAGLQLALAVIEQLEAEDLSQYPGIEAWLKDLHKSTRGMSPETPVEKWPKFDVDALMAHNPNFWQAYYEIAPGDPGLMVIHAGLLMSAGEMSRASHILVIALQRPGVPRTFREGMLGMLSNTMQAGKASEALVNEGVKLHDKGKYEAALAKYEEALAAWPQNDLAHYELGYTIFTQSLVAAGEKPPAAGAVIVNKKLELPAKAKAAYAKSRYHDPLEYMAYQGDEKPVIDGLRVLLEKGLPVWQKLAKEPETRIDYMALQDFSNACQEAGIDELGLVVRQVMVARRGRYAPSDHPYFTTSLRKLAPGKQTDALLKRLATGVLSVKQLVVPEEEKRDFAVKQLRLYIPVPDLSKRLGQDVEPFGSYARALSDPIQQWVEKEKPAANGLLIAVGIKAGKQVRVWCQAVEGDIPAAALTRLEKELGKMATIDVKKEPMAFGLEIEIGGRKVEEFPPFPAVWLDAAKKSKIDVIVPPDELFKVIWPD
jgi:tetratricopeptide (TPR) repeat protein